MKNHASMNRIYRLVWNAALGLWVAVAETAKGKARGGAACSVLRPAGAATSPPGLALHARCRAALIMLLSMAVANQQVHAADAANASLVVGAGTVNTAGNVTTINQASQNMALDWTSLSTRANEALIFNQPNASAIALNRITGTSPSELLGSLTANGQVFILNPNGVLFGAGSQVNVGGLVASTMNLSNADFEAGNFKFSGSGSGAVVNQGTLTAAAGGYLALLAPEVRNEGVMVASLGTALLAAGNKVTLNLDNGSLLGYSIDQGAINALAENKQLIQADGGQVLLSARAMDSLTTATVNNTGIIEAKTMQNKAGRILLMGDMETGTVNVAGTLDASAPNGGDGGFVETSAANVKVAAGTRVTTRAASGNSGTWLIDPVDFTISAGAAAQDISGMGADTLSANLDNGNVSIATSATTAGNGDISVNSAVNWSAASVLTLAAHRDVNFNANLTYTGSGTAGVNAQAVRDINVATNMGITATGTGALPVVFGGATVGTAAGGNINMASGSSIASNGGNVTFKANAIQLSGATVAAAGGNIAMTASGANATHSLEITNDGATESSVSTTGAGTINLSGNLSGDGSGAGGDASGVKITSSTVSANAGDVTISGDSGWSGSAVTKIARGVRLDSGAKVLGAGKITVTGRAGDLTPRGSYGYPPDPASAGLEIAQGALVSSSAGNIDITGTFNNPSAYDGVGVIIKGKVQSGPAGRINVTGSAWVGDSSGTGFQLGSTGQLLAGTGGLTIASTVQSATTATAIVSAQLSGTINSTGAIDINAAVSAPSAANAMGLWLNGGSINANGANITLAGSGVPAPATAGSKELSIEGTTVTSAGGVITLVGDRMEILSAINAGAAGRVVIAPSPFTSNRQITLGNGSESNALNLSNSELSQITAGEVQIGTSSFNGGIEITGSITAAPGPLPTISLVQGTQNGFSGTITQTGGSFSVKNLNVTAGSVDLSRAGNSFDSVSGQAFGGSFNTGNFNIRSDKAGPLAVGAITALNNVTLNATAGTITDNNGAANNITAASLTASSLDGISLDTEVSGLSTLTTTGAAGDIRIGTSRAIDLSNTSQYLISTDAGSAQNVSLATSSASGITVGNMFASTGDNIALTASGGNITLNGDISANGLALSALGSINANADINVNDVFELKSGSMIQVGSALPDFYADDFRITGGTFMRALGGNGLSTATAYQISDVYGLQGAGSAGMLDKNFKLANDISAAGTACWNNCLGSYFGFMPIGNSATPFTGTFDGQSHTISNLKINRPADVSVGLFGETGSSAVIGNVGLSQAEVNGNHDVGLLVGYNRGSINNSYSSGDVTSTGDAVGGLVGTNEGAITNTYSTADVVSHGGQYAGGLVGYQYNVASISNSYASGVINSADGGGGLAGFTSASTITNSFRANDYGSLASQKGGTLLTGAALLTASTFTGASWSASNVGGDGTVWRIYEGNAGNVGPLLRSFLTGTTVAGSTAGYDATTKTVAGATSGVHYASGRNAGSYTSYSDQEGYDITGGLLTINKADITLASADVTKTYDGTTSAAGTIAINSGTVFSGDSITGGSFVFANKNASTGDKVVNVSGVTVGDGVNNANYNITYAANTTSTINKAALTVTANAVTRDYDGTTAASGAGTAGTLAGALAGELVNAVGSQAFADKNAGGGKTVNASGVTIKDSGSADVTSNYNITYVANNTSVINQANLTLGTTNVTKTYDGTTSAAGTVAINSGTVFSGDSITGGSFAFANKNASTGDKVVNVSGVTVGDGVNNANYNITYAANTTSTINKTTLNISATPDNKVYDGTTAATASYTDNRIAGDVLSYSAVAAFADKNVANGIAVSVGGITTSGTDAGNYTVGSTTVIGSTADITPRTLTVTANDDTRLSGTPYSGGNGVSYSGIVAGETVAGVLTGNVAYSGDSQGASLPGEYDITPGGLTANSNYRLNFMEGTLTLKAGDAASAALGSQALVSSYNTVLNAVAGLGGGGGGGSNGGGGSSGGSSGGGGGVSSNSPNAAGAALNAAAADSGSDGGDK